MKGEKMPTFGEGESVRGEQPLDVIVDELLNIGQSLWSTNALRSREIKGIAKRLATIARVQAEPAPQGTCDLVSQPHQANHCGKAWRPLCKCDHSFYAHAIEHGSACLVGDCECEAYRVARATDAQQPSASAPAKKNKT